MFLAVIRIARALRSSHAKHIHELWHGTTGKPDKEKKYFSLKLPRFFAPLRWNTYLRLLFIR